MSVTLLDQTRKISKLLHDNSSRVVIFNDICGVVGKILSASCMVVSAKGKVLGIYEEKASARLTGLIADSVGDMIDENLNNRFLSVLSTKENVNLQTLGFDRSDTGGISAILLPVFFAGQRMGTTFIYRDKKDYEVEDIILSEYANTVIELEIMRAIYEEDDEQKRRKEILRAAMESLSSSEQEAVKYLVAALPGTEGALVTSKVAAENHMTRSILVNAIKKLEGAGVLEVKSMGMRGTHIRVLNETLLTYFQDADPKF
ncbi:MAG: GTP-sensing pleiotropic transcriptional regulator CodY [Eubacterium sp.]|nr:GTP-sensing pleiotropic transcriptional regulator CodY [Eubacterium sp.]